jgi:DNA-binding GntR family transcriptional regulator
MSPTHRDSSDGNATKRDIIVRRLREQITSGELPRGAKMRQDELASRFHTSITPVREALRVLQAEGLLVGEARRGVRVATVDPRQLKVTYLTRRLLESYAMRRAARRVNPRDLERARRLIDGMRAAFEAGDHAKVRDQNRAFHFLFIDRCGIPELAHEIDMLWLAFPWDILQVLKHRTPHSIEEHEAMLSAVIAGDQEEIGRATGRHLAQSYLCLVEHLSGTRPDDPFDVDND